MNEAKLFRTNLSLITTKEMALHLINTTNNSVAVCNANSVVRGARSGGMASMINSMTYKICDGYPLSKALNILYGVKQERVDGFNIFHKTITEGIKDNTSHYFFGNIEEVTLKMISELEKEYPNIVINGYYCPPMQDTSKFLNEEYPILLDETKADIIWISLGFPKQEKFMQYIMENKKNDFNILGVGNVFDWVAKTKYKAPEFFAKNGFEWLFRFSQEPIRLARRYLIDNTLFIYFFLKQYFGFKI
jgi:N-acetylglucosaminyldiphosphoundecaprenol N-acetyl-beta-D-mannosaminyltransferase